MDAYSDNPMVRARVHQHHPWRRNGRRIMFRFKSDVSRLPSSVQVRETFFFADDATVRPLPRFCAEDMVHRLHMAFIGTSRLGERCWASAVFPAVRRTKDELLNSGSTDDDDIAAQ